MTVPRPLFALLVGASSLAIATSGLSQTTPQENPFEQMNQALQAGQSQLQESEFDAAARSFSEVVRIAEALNQTPQLVAGYLGRATALSALEEFEDAKKDYRAAIQENEELAEAHNGLGEILYDESQVLQAYGSFEKAVKRDRSNPVYLLNLGKSQIRIGLAVPAIKSLTKVIEAEPENAEAYSHRGQAQAAIGKFEAAYADMAKAIELDSANHETHYALGLIQMREPNYAGAISAFYDAKERYRPASADEPPYIDPYLGAALAYLELGKAAENQADQKIAYNAAVVDTNRALEEALETQPQRQLALFNRGVAQRLLGQYDEAIESLSEAIAMAPDTFSEGYFRRGIVWHYMNEHNLARLDFEKALSIAFDDPRPNLWLGYTHAALEDYHTATRYYGQALKQDERFVPAYVNRGLAYVQLEDLEKALRDFNEAIRVEPTVADHYYKRGAVQMMTGDYDSAVVSFRNAIQFKSDFREAYERLADSYQAAGDLQAAREVREAAAQLVTSVESPAASKESGSTLPAPELSPIPDQPANTFQPAQPALDIIENPPAAAAGDAFADPLEAAVADELVPIEESDPTLPLPAEDKERPLNPFE